jgi:hypothetical protein
VSNVNEGSHKNNCFDCLHFFITHEPAYPYGCRAMSFKSRELPAMVVLKDSGAPCMLFEIKGRPEGTAGRRTT